MYLPFKPLSIISVLLVVQAFVGCGTSTEPILGRQFKIVVDPAQPIADRNAQYTMYATDDTSFRAYKYLWDFDERYTLPKRDVKNPYHIFSDTLSHNISCFAQDSLDHNIGEAHVRIQSVPPVGSMKIHATTAPMDWQTVLFGLTVAPHFYSFDYVWDFGDGTTATLHDTTATHEYQASGTYIVRVTAYESSYVYARDSISVTVNQLSASAAELAQMGSLSVYGTYYGDTNQVDFLELPLVNKGDYAYTGPPNLEMVYRHSSHSASVDSAQLRQVLGTLNSSGQMINGFSFVSFDTVHRIDPNREEFYSKLISVIADTLSIEYKTTDSVAFVSPTRVGVHALNIDRSSQTPSTDPCPGIDPIEILPRLGPVSFVVDRLKLVWRR